MIEETSFYKILNSQQIQLSLLVTPGSRQTRVIGRHGNQLKVAVSAQPEDGEANLAVVELISDWLGLSPRDVQFKVGQKNRSKIVVVPNQSDVIDKLDMFT